MIFVSNYSAKSWNYIYLYQTVIVSICWEFMPTAVIRCNNCLMKYLVYFRVTLASTSGSCIHFRRQFCYIHWNGNATILTHFLFTGCTTCCQNNIFQCQWRKSLQNDICVSKFTHLYCITLMYWHNCGRTFIEHPRWQSADIIRVKFFRNRCHAKQKVSHLTHALIRHARVYWDLHQSQIRWVAKSTKFNIRILCMLIIHEYQCQNQCDL